MWFFVADSIALSAAVVVFSVCCNGTHHDVTCERQAKIGQDEFVQYKFQDVSVGDTVSLTCCFKKSKQPRIWYYQDRFQVNGSGEVSYVEGKMKVSEELELFIGSMVTADSGTYYCRSVFDEEADKIMKYTLDVLPDDPVKPITGRIPDFEEYQRWYIDSVNDELAGDEPTAIYFRKELAITFKIHVGWLTWSACDGCLQLKSKQGRCRIGAYRDDPDICQTTKNRKKKRREINCQASDNMIRDMTNLACYSPTLAVRLPTIYEKIKNTPTFILYSKCRMECEEPVRVTGLIYRHLIPRNLTVGQSITLSCPGDTLEKEVVWRRDGIVLREGVNVDEPVNVDLFSILRIKQASLREEGNYTCYLDQVMVQQNLVVVTEDFFVKYASVFRHMYYLLYLLLICFIAYVGVMVITCAKYHSFKRVDVEDVLRHYQRTNIVEYPFQDIIAERGKS